MEPVQQDNAKLESERLWVGLIARIAQADQAAFAEFYDTTSRLIYGLVLRIIGNPADAEETTLDVYSQIWRQAARFDAERGKASAWFFMIARSRALDAARARSLRLADQHEPLEVAVGLHDAARDPHENSDIAGRRASMQSALTALGDDQRAVIEMAYYGGLSDSEISERLGAPLGTVKTRIRLGMNRLREKLQFWATEI